MPTQCNTKPLEFKSGTRSQPEQDGSTISVFGGHTDGVVEVDHYSDIRNASLSEGGALAVMVWTFPKHRMERGTRNHTDFPHPMRQSNARLRLACPCGLYREVI